MFVACSRLSRFWPYWPAALAVISLFGSAPCTAARPAAAIEFNRDVRPILSDKCFLCHGPDRASRQADLRLDVRQDALAARDGASPIVPGHAADSEVIRRIISDDPDEQMPPPKSGLKLAAREIEALKQWIDAGAEYQAHWALIPPRRPPVPAIKQVAGAANSSPLAGEGGAREAANPVDHFIRARLESQAISPAAEADKPTLLRRVTFDLTGLPPTPAEVDAFLADTSPEAYDKAVDRLLTSPRYGERMATNWLDAARYADTNGYQSDEQRQMWRWRDWVIEAFNRNLPFDQFTIQQLAGDLLPNPTLEQIVATGFNRNHRANSEGGIIAEEFLVEYAVDRLDTTATVWLGLTIGCARCHDHKYDPITQKEFYQLLAFFNNVPEQGKVTRVGNAPPMIQAPTPAVEKEIQRLDAALASAEAAWQAMRPDLAAAQRTWEKTFSGDAPVVIESLTVHFELDGQLADAQGKHTAAKPVGNQPAFTSGPVGQAAKFDGNQFLDAGDLANFSESAKFSYGAWIRPEGTGPMAVLSRMDQDESYLGYDLFIDGGKVQADLVNRLLDDSLRVETTEPLSPGAWHHVLVTYDGSRTAKGLRIYVDGVRAKLKSLSETLSNSIITTEPLRIGARGKGSRFRGLIDDVRIYNRELTADEAASLASVESIRQIVDIVPAGRTPAQAQKLQSYFLAHAAPAKMAAAFAKLTKQRKLRKDYEKTIPTTMVMQEKPTRGDTFVLIRGEYDKPGEKVSAGVPAALPPLSASHGEQPNRLALARWLVDPSNPLMARVTVNRFWQLYFGIGLVKTVEDFGAQGEVPVQQDLLDWLATEFIRTGWDVKRLQKLIVTSATYRQSSKLSPALLARDSDNRLLARGPRYRLSAEMIRDAVLAASGLLIEQVGGPSVKPYQPAGLWEELGATAGKYPQEHGESLYRRSMYTFWKRTIPPPSMMIFDAAGREMCSVRHTRTNTPLQALTLLNDVPYVEAARKLAERTLLHGGSDDDQRLTFAFRLATARQPRPQELAILRAGLARHRDEYRRHPDAAKPLLAVGESPHDSQLPPAELAAYTVMASVILNLDETITKE
ncbi:MAG TPA: DUF1553 domain-containing protein [Pirellulales bacterium]|jgi:hypothetical protein|nr:DUF1553 domain-containing protein [Pirellulales bacterium]